MTNERWKTLMNDDTLNLTPEEIEDGWHWCHEFDGLLRQPQDEPYEYDGEIVPGFKCGCLDH